MIQYLRIFVCSLSAYLSSFQFGFYDNLLRRHKKFEGEEKRIIFNQAPPPWSLPPRLFCRASCFHSRVLFLFRFWRPPSLPGRVGVEWCSGVVFSFSHRVGVHNEEAFGIVKRESCLRNETVFQGSHVFFGLGMGAQYTPDPAHKTFF